MNISILSAIYQFTFRLRSLEKFDCFGLWDGRVNPTCFCSKASDWRPVAMEVSKPNNNTFPSLGDLDDFLTKHNSNFVWLLVGRYFDAISIQKNSWRYKGRKTDHISYTMLHCSIQKVYLCFVHFLMTRAIKKKKIV